MLPNIKLVMLCSFFIMIHSSEKTMGLLKHRNYIIAKPKFVIQPKIYIGKPFITKKAFAAKTVAIGSVIGLLSKLRPKIPLSAKIGLSKIVLPHIIKKLPVSLSVSLADKHRDENDDSEDYNNNHSFDEYFPNPHYDPSEQAYIDEYKLSESKVSSYDKKPERKIRKENNEAKNKRNNDKEKNYDKISIMQKEKKMKKEKDIKIPDKNWRKSTKMWSEQDEKEENNENEHDSE